jgi:hypothetical protein
MWGISTKKCTWRKWGGVVRQGETIQVGTLRCSEATNNLIISMIVKRNVLRSLFTNLHIWLVLHIYISINNSFSKRGN